MPTINIESNDISCMAASEFIRAGADQLRHLFTDGDSINHTCTNIMGGLQSGSIYFGQDYHRQPEWMGFVVIYALCVLMLLAAFYFLHRKGASPRDVFYWGALSLIVPILGPLVTVVFCGLAARNNG